MISATISKISQEGSNVSLEYVLTDDQDGAFSKQGRIPISIGWAPSDIKTQLVAIMDAADYVASLKPLLNVKINSTNVAPKPIKP